MMTLYFLPTSWLAWKDAIWIIWLFQNHNNGYFCIIFVVLDNLFFNLVHVDVWKWPIHNIGGKIIWICVFQFPHLALELYQTRNKHCIFLLWFLQQDDILLHQILCPPFLDQYCPRFFSLFWAFVFSLSGFLIGIFLPKLSIVVRMW